MNKSWLVYREKIRLKNELENLIFTRDAAHLEQYIHAPHSSGDICFNLCRANAAEAAALEQRCALQASEDTAQRLMAEVCTCS